MLKLFYRGPSIDILHETYAKRGQIDGRAPVHAADRVVVEAPPDRVWAVLSDPSRWPEIDDAIHDVQVDGPAATDVRFTWANGKARMKSRFAVVDPGREIAWTGTSSGAKAVHRHLLEATGDGSTVVHTEESMAGPMLTLFYPSAKLTAATKTWLEGLKRAAEAPPA
jgi:carbon monoxide dehydrogenase subunit G